MFRIIHKEGRTIHSHIRPAAVRSTSCCNACGTGRPLPAYHSSCCFIGSAVFVLYFFRNPKRLLFIEEGAIIAPADGKIVVVEETDELEYFWRPQDTGIHLL